MEQKQLDEIDESYFGEEFVDEELLAVTKDTMKNSDILTVSGLEEEIKIEEVEPEPKPRKRVNKKRIFKEMKVEKPKEETVEIKVEKVNPFKEVKLEEKVETVKEAPKVEIIEEQLKEKVTVKKVKEEKNPNEHGLFEEASTWKAVTGIVIILLIFSVFTQGFHFTEENEIINSKKGSIEGKEISLEKAEKRVLEYVNSQILQPPFVATIVNSAEFGSFYKFVLSIADEEIDSFITKDGRMFFPQGIDISYYLFTEPVEEVELDLEDSVKVEVIDEGSVVEEEQVVEEVVEEPVVVPPSTSLNELSVTAKKWLFLPHKLNVAVGETVKLTILPENLDFTFSIPGLGVEQEVSGETVVKFTATQTGTFDFSCSSCDEWRGMTGTLTVE